MHSYGMPQRTQAPCDRTASVTWASVALGRRMACRRPIVADVHSLRERGAATRTDTGPYLKMATRRAPYRATSMAGRVSGVLRLSSSSAASAALSLTLCCSRSRAASTVGAPDRCLIFQAPKFIEKNTQY